MQLLLKIPCTNLYYISYTYIIFCTFPFLYIFYIHIIYIHCKTFVVQQVWKILQCSIAVTLGCIRCSLHLIAEIKNLRYSNIVWRVFSTF